MRRARSSSKRTLRKAVSQPEFKDSGRRYSERYVEGIETEMMMKYEILSH
jgi:hypothetical protein